MATSYYKLYKTDVDNDYFWMKNESGNIAFFRLNAPFGSTIFINEGVVSYSRDKVEWNSTSNTVNQTIQVGPYEKIYFRSSNGWSKASNQILVFMSSAPFSLGGPITSLIDYTNMENITTVPDWCFACICGNGNSIGSTMGNITAYNIVDISQIDLGNITTIGEGSFYQSFFIGSGNQQYSKITKLPDFSKITTIGRQGMWQMCNNVTTVTGKLSMPNLTSIGFGGLETAFSYANFTEAPDFSALTTIGEEGLFHTFEFNYNMKGQPLMSNVTTIGDKGMNQCFYSNYQLNRGADLLSCTTIGSTNSFSNCYSNCYNLEEVTAPNISSWDTNTFYNWLSNAGIRVSGTKTFNAPTGLDIPTNNYSGIPNGWTRVDY